MSAIDLSGNCEVCKRFLEIDYTNIPLESKCKLMTDDVIKHHEHMKSVHDKKRKTFAFTFTTNSDSQLEIQKEMCFAAYKLYLQRTTPVLQGEVYLEYTEAGRPHLHGWYETEDGGRIFAKTFRRCWPHWAEKDRQKHFAGGYHEEMKTNRYKDYASSEERKVISKAPNADVIYIGENADKWHI